MNLFRKLFDRSENLTSSSDIIRWWETRRLIYNGIVGVTGIIVCILQFALVIYSQQTFDKPIGLPDPPIAVILGIIIYGVMANVCYTAGWMAELLARNLCGPDRAKSFGLLAFKLGLSFSVILTTVPVVVTFLFLAGIEILGINPTAPSDHG